MSEFYLETVRCACGLCDVQEASYTSVMRRGTWVTIVGMLAVMSLGAQDGALDRQAFIDLVRFDTSLSELEAAVDDPDLTESLIDRILVFDGVVSSVAVWQADTPQDFYSEIEIVSGTWTSVATIETHRALIIAAGSDFAPRVFARQPREPEPGQVYRTQRVLIAGTLQGFAELGGQELPVVQAYEIRIVP